MWETFVSGSFARYPGRTEATLCLVRDILEGDVDTSGYHISPVLLLFADIDIEEQCQRARTDRQRSQQYAFSRSESKGAH